ncbi:MAG: hypothetical protein HXS46_15625 [Theionarchaea archaeon]|nr:hypothetical protein [Theionarchaea archaeon]
MKKIQLLGLVLTVLVVTSLPVWGWVPVVKISMHVDNLNNSDCYPQIAVDAPGNSYVVWQGYDGIDNEIYWVKIDATGSQGGVQKISTHLDNIATNDEHPQIAVDFLGNSYVTWCGHDGNDYEIYWVKIDAESVMGAVQKISLHPDNVNDWDNYPQIAVDASGNSYVTWMGRGRDDDEIYWVKIDAESVMGAVQKISLHPDNINGHEEYPQIAVDALGNSFVTWSGHDGNDEEIYWVRISAKSTAGTVQKVSTHLDNVNNWDKHPRVAIDSLGNSYITWMGLDSNDYEIYWVKIDAESVMGAVQKISLHPDNANTHDDVPQIAVDASGNSYITWQGKDEADHEIYWTRVDTSGSQGAVQKISTHPDNVGACDDSPQIAIDSLGDSYVTWCGYDGNDTDIYWAKLDATGSSSSVHKISTHQENTTHNDWRPQICVDGSANSYITWYGHDGYDDEVYWVSTISETITFSALARLFFDDTFLIAGDQAYSTDVLGSAKIAHVLGQAGAENPEGRTETILTPLEHDTGNLIPVGGPAVSPIADEFDQYFGITYVYTENTSFEIHAVGHSIFLDVTQYPHQDICIIYLGKHNERNVMLVWGYGWQGTYAGSVIIGDQKTWQTHADAHVLMVRWTDSNADGLVQADEITVEQFV